MAFLSFVDQTYYEQFRVSSSGDTNAVTDDFFDWANRHADRLTSSLPTRIAPSASISTCWRCSPTTRPTLALDTIYFAVFPFRFHAGDGTYRRYSGYYYAAEDIDYGWLHEMGHQLGLIDLYQMDVPTDANLVSGQGYSTVAT